MKELIIYLLTGNKCNLNCDHCFLGGQFFSEFPELLDINNVPGFQPFNIEATANWLKKLHKYTPNTSRIHIELFGEPFFGKQAVTNLKDLYNQTALEIWDHTSWGAVTNLVFKLKDEHLNFIKTFLKGRVATSWDSNIRFKHPNQLKLWEANVRTLVKLGIEVKVFVSLTKNVVETDPIQILEYFKDLGVKEVDFERLTNNGKATLNSYKYIYPTNKQLDEWFVKIYQQTVKYKAYKWFENTLLVTILKNFLTDTSGGTFCRDCEQKIFTVNYNGAIAGCPNSAMTDYYGHIDQEIPDLIFSPKRFQIIRCEQKRDPRCLECPVFDKCGGDCHQLEWQKDQCASPKSLLILLTQENNMELYQDIVNYKHNN